MPRGDQTGPNGEGPMTGRAMGYCAGFGMPGFANSGFGRGFGFRRGFGRRFVQPMAFQPVEFTEEDEKKVLQQELKEIEQEKKEIEKRLREIKQ